MNKRSALLSLVFILSFCPTFAQDSGKIVKDSSRPCLLTKATIPIMGSMKLGSSLSELRRVYPELRATDALLTPNTTAYLTVSPFSDISHLLFLFSSEDKLDAYSLIYPPKQWTSIEVPFKQAMTSLTLTVSRDSWTIWSENERETITVQCKDFGLVATLSPLKNDRTSGTNSKRFTFTVIDNSVVGGLAGDTQNRQAVPKTRTDSGITVFPQANSEFTVQFPQKPTIKTVQSEFGPVEQADYVSDDYTILRAEYGNATTERLSAVHNATQEQLSQIGMALGKLFGYTAITVTSGKTNLGTYVKIRGYKTIAGAPYLIEHLMYYGKRSIMTVVTAAKATDYPTRKVYDFVNSIKRKFE